MAQPPEGDSQIGGLPKYLNAWASSVLGYLHARLMLAGMEGKEALGVFVRTIVLLLFALLLLGFGYAFLWVGLVAALAGIFNIPWSWLVIGAGVLHLLLALIGIWRIGRLWRKPLFKATMEEFQKESRWLGHEPKPQYPHERAATKN